MKNNSTKKNDETNAFGVSAEFDSISDAASCLFSLGFVLSLIKENVSDEQSELYKASIYDIGIIIQSISTGILNAADEITDEFIALKGSQNSEVENA